MLFGNVLGVNSSDLLGIVVVGAMVVTSLIAFQKEFGFNISKWGFEI